jgi:DNA polymerase-1
MLGLLPYRAIVAADFEFEFGGHASFEDASRSGERPQPVCMVAKELRTGQEWRMWRDELLASTRPPFPTGADALFVAFYASAELGCFRALGWSKPENILDLFAEFRNYTNMSSRVDQDRRTPSGAGLVGALTYFGLDTIGAQEKDDLRRLILSGGPWSDDERTAILAYCATDIDALERLLLAMLPRIDLPRALLRGRYMAAAAAMEWNGTRIDVESLALLRANWDHIKDELIAAVDDAYGVYDGGTFKENRWAAYLTRHNIAWPLLETKRLDLSRDTFRQMARAYPAVAPVHELRHALSEMRLNDLAVGRDGRNRTILSAFRSRTGRNQPSNTRYIFGPSTWLRSLIKPPSGHGVAYIDWAQQEIGVAAALSGDLALQAAYRSGDCYLAFAKQAGAVPQDATKQTHKSARELFKQCVLAVQYGMGAEALALRIAQPPVVARDLLRAHRETYRTFWQWSDAAVDHAMLMGSLRTVFGWNVHVGADSNSRSLRNFPMQANGAEMMRLAACLATERGIEVCAPVHDAFLICAPLDRLEADVATMRACMAEAAWVVLGGFELLTEATIVRYPDRYSDPRGAVMWTRVMELIDQRQRQRRQVAKVVA